MSNPVLKGFYADPDIACFNGKFYLYPTTDGGVEWDASSFKAFSSDDLVHWSDEGVILDLARVPWTQGKHAWAPAIGEKNGKYYFYYSGNKNIGVAVSDSPCGPFCDIGRPLIDGKRCKGAFDPDVFVDENGDAYLYWGNGHLYAARLAPDMISLDGPIVDLTPAHYCEGPCVFKRKGLYYFTWCNNDTRSPDYQVRYGTSTDPLRAPEGDTVILSRANTDDPRIKCTGHHSILNIPGTDDWYICYHRFNIERYGHVEGFSTEAGNHREVCIDALTFDDQGNILPIKATLDGISPVQSDTL